MTHLPSPALLLERLLNKSRRDSLQPAPAKTFPSHYFRGQLHSIEDHLVHIPSAFHVSLFKQAVTVSVGGFGDLSSAGWGGGCGSCIEVHCRVQFPHSVGNVFQALTTPADGFPRRTSWTRLLS